MVCQRLSNTLQPKKKGKSDGFKIVDKPLKSVCAIIRGFSSVPHRP